jgi:2-keto-4-pentenoate hydratase/2-oxohepta-3-ene-1,7-dioic acid hydratase in catechol pathway
MRWARIEHQGKPRFAVVHSDRLEIVEGDPLTSYRATGESVPLAGAKLLPPIVPPTFYAAGMNYLGHTAEMRDALGEAKAKVPTQADIGYRANNSLIGQGESIVIPRGSSGAVQYEGELVVVIGKKARKVSESEALNHVFGYTIGNDVSERTWQKSDRTLWRAKNSDTFAPMGPWIETDVELGKLVTRVRLNGKQVAEFATNSMIFGVERYISEITKYITLWPGDVIWMGAESPTKDMVAGDTVEVEIDGIGVLRNPIVAEGSAAR